MQSPLLYDSKPSYLSLRVWWDDVLPISMGLA